MIINATDPGANLLRVIDTVTGEDLNSITRVDTESGEAWGYVHDAEGKVITSGDALVVEKHANPVRMGPMVRS